MHNADIQCTVEGKEEAKGHRKFFMFKLSLVCLRIQIFIASIVNFEKQRHSVFRASVGDAVISLSPACGVQ